MSLDGPRRPNYLIFDAFDIEIVVKVLRMSLFSQFFAVFVPLIIRGQGYKWPSVPLYWSTAYAVAVCGWSIVSHASRLLLSPNRPYLGAGPRVNWFEQIVLITGGSAGIGGLLAETLAMRGVRVVVLDIKEGEWEGEVGRNNIAFYKCDVSNKADVDRVAEQVREEIGDPTMLVNNAGIVHGKSLLELSEADINKTIGVNLTSHFWTLKAFLPAMIAKKEGHIMTVSSTLGLVGASRMADYCATKAALIQLHESLRWELNSLHSCPSIHTSILLPAHIHTKLFAEISLPQTGLFRFFCPGLEPHAVVKRMVQVLARKESEVMMMPSYVKLVPWIRWVPVVREFVQWISGADHAMDNFHPGPSKAVEEKKEI